MRVTRELRIVGLMVALTVSATAGCDHGLAPPELQAPGGIRGTVHYIGEWPPESEFRDLRFVAMRFVPRDTSDFLDLNRMAISGRLRYGVAVDTFTVGAVDPGVFFYAGVAQQFSRNILDWRPLGLVSASDGTFEVTPGAITNVTIDVDFAHPPVFPPR